MGGYVNKSRSAGELFKQNTEDRETISTKYRKQGKFLNKIQKAGELFQQNTESRGTI